MGGQDGVFSSMHDGVIGSPLPNDFVPINFPANSIVLLYTENPVRITEFRVRANQVCSNNDVLGVSITYTSADSQQQVSSVFCQLP